MPLINMLWIIFQLINGGDTCAKCKIWKFMTHTWARGTETEHEHEVLTATKRYLLHKLFLKYVHHILIIGPAVIDLGHHVLNSYADAVNRWTINHKCAFKYAVNRMYLGEAIKSRQCKGVHFCQTQALIHLTGWRCHMKAALYSDQQSSTPQGKEKQHSNIRTGTNM